MWFATTYNFGHDSVYTPYAPDVGIAVKPISTTIAMFQNLHLYLWLKTSLENLGRCLILVIRRSGKAIGGRPPIKITCLKHCLIGEGEREG